MIRADRHLAPDDHVMPPVCILAGGLGTRLGQLAEKVPKPLVEVAGEPFLVHQLRLLAAHGVDQVVLCVGHLGEMIEDAIGQECAGIEISYSYDQPGLDGTLGAIQRALPLLGDRFLYLYGDTYLRIDYQAADLAWLHSAKPALMTVLRNASKWDTSNAVYAHGLVTAYDKAALSPEMQWIDYGLGGLSSEALRLARQGERDLAGLHHRLAVGRQLCGYEATERFYEIGTPAALSETDRFLRERSHGNVGSDEIVRHNPIQT
ncbi:MAG: nucleotidyl transferase [Acidimicrobiaceae bacterium]|nr:nucleotidyl transferase [Acidimicrobiaceae bacterium]